MKKTIKAEIYQIVDSLILEVNAAGCTTEQAMVCGIVKHSKFLDYATSTPDMILNIERDKDGEIQRVDSYYDLGKIIGARVRWNLKNLRSEHGLPMFYTTNRRTGKLNLRV